MMCIEDTYIEIDISISLAIQATLFCLCILKPAPGYAHKLNLTNAILSLDAVWISSPRGFDNQQPHMRGHSGA